LHRLSRFGHSSISNCLSMLSLFTPSGKDIKSGQSEIRKCESDMRCPIWFGREEIPLQSQIVRDRREVRCWILCGNEFSCEHPWIYKCSRAVRYCTPLDKEASLSQPKTCNRRRECKPHNPLIGRDFNPPQLFICSDSKEFRFWRPSGKLSSSSHSIRNKRLRANRLSSWFDSDLRFLSLTISKRPRTAWFFTIPPGRCVKSQKSSIRREVREVKFLTDKSDVSSHCCSWFLMF
jgi:hypothetical protein